MVKVGTGRDLSLLDLYENLSFIKEITDIPHHTCHNNNCDHIDDYLTAPGEDPCSKGFDHPEKQMFSSQI